MPRLYTRSSKGRKSLLSSPTRLTRSRAHDDRPNQSHRRQKSRSSSEASSHSIPARASIKRRKLAPPTQRAISDVEEQEGVSDGAHTDDEDEDEDEVDEDDVEPIVFAPSRTNNVRQTGRKISPLEYEDRLFDSSDDDDDDVYERVNEISDYEDDADEQDVEAFELQQILASGQDFLASESEDDPTAILDHIDGLSVLGFGGDVDVSEELATLSDGSGTNSDTAAERHVHFPNDLEHSRGIMGSVSPLLTRALLPSALPANAGAAGSTSLDQSLANDSRGMPWIDHATGSQRPRGVFFEDPDDSDATDEDLPAEAHTTPIALHRTFIESASDEHHLANSSSRADQKRSTRQRGPRRGFFQVDKDKPWAILDPSGKKIVLLPAPNTDRHDWLEAKVQQPFNSTQTSPAASFAQLLDESDESVTSSQENLDAMMNGAEVDVMLAGLNSTGNIDIDGGHATGPSEAFYPPLGYQVVGDYVVSPDDMEAFENASDISNEAHLPITMDDFIEFDDDDASNGDDCPTSPAIYMPPLHELSSTRSVDDQFAHLNNRNVTAFRRSADPSRVAWDERAAVPEFSAHQVAMFEASTPTPGRKRKATNPPYTDTLYEGVTPVQRRIIGTTKRRKVTT